MQGVPHRRRRCSAYLVDQQGRRRPRRSERAAGDGEADREQMEATARRRRCSSASLPPPRCSPQTPVPRRDPFRRPRRAAAAFVVAARRGLPPNRKTKWPWFAETRKYALDQGIRSLAAVQWRKMKEGNKWLGQPCRAWFPWAPSLDFV